MHCRNKRTSTVLPSYNRPMSCQNKQDKEGIPTSYPATDQRASSESVRGLSPRPGRELILVLSPDFVSTARADTERACYHSDDGKETSGPVPTIGVKMKERRRGARHSESESSQGTNRGPHV